MNIVALDTETALFGPGNMAPPLTCVSLANSTEVELLTIADNKDMRRWLLSLFKNKNTAIVGHNIAYDMGVLCAEYPDLEFVSAVFDLYYEGRVLDTMTREKLIDIAAGPGLKGGKGKYSLATIAKDRLGLEMDKDTHRLTYGELRNVPQSQWPAGAALYALDDATATLMVYNHQQAQADDYLDGHALVNELEQTRGDFALHLQSVYGIRTDRAAIDAVEATARAKYDALKEILIKAKVLTLKSPKHPERGYKMGRKFVTSLVEDACEDMGMEVPVSEKGNVKTDRMTLNDTHDELLMDVALFKEQEKILSTYVPLLRRGQDEPLHNRYSLVNSGRVSSSPNQQNWPVRGGLRECIVPRPGYVFCSVDFDTAELRALSAFCEQTFGYSRMAEVLRAGEDPHLMLAATLLGITVEEAKRRKKEPEVKDARQLSKCFHPDTEALTKTGWKRIGELTMQDEVLQAWPERGSKAALSWTKPTALWTNESPGELVHLKNEGIDLRVTPDHRMLAYSNEQRPYVCIPEEIGSARVWLGAGELDEASGCSPDEKTIRLAIATQADGSFTTNQKIRFGFTKKRKVDRLLELLKDEDYTMKEIVMNDKPAWTFVVTGTTARRIRNVLDVDKTIPWAWLAYTKRCREVAVEEAAFWDSHVRKGGRSYGYSSVAEKNVDVLQAMAVSVGRKARKKFSKRGKPHHNDQHVLAVKDRAHVRAGALDATRVPYTGKVVCLSVPSSFVLVRDGGVPVITGQCVNFGLPGGMGAKTFVLSAKKQGYVLTERRAKELKALWLQTWPEMVEFFQYAALATNANGGKADIVTPWSNRLRADCFYSEFCNQHFQGPVSDAAKAATFALAYECYTGRPFPGVECDTTTSPLFGSRPMMFIHDENIAELPVATAAKAAQRMAKVMGTVGSSRIPLVPLTCSPALMLRLSKGASTVYNEQGELTVWQ